MSERCSVQVAEPLLRHADGYWAELADRGYSRKWATSHLRLMAHLSRWLAAEGLEATDLTAPTVERFITARRQAGYRHLVSARSLDPLIKYLGRCGVAPAPASSFEASPLDRLLGEYRSYLTDQRGLACGTVRQYLQVARLFLAEQGELPELALRSLGAEQVTGFVLRQCQERTEAAARMLVWGLRSLLRFLHANGSIPSPLAQAVPAVARRRQALPRDLDAQTVARLLSSCDRRGAVGRRDYAILLVLVRLAMRCGEVAALRLEDVDWRAGELIIRTSKARRRDRLPLPHDVGEALVGYLEHGRHHVAGRALFVSARAPRTGLSSDAVRQVVRRACARAGTPACGAHRLRHTAATQLLRKGAPLAEIAQLLRHRSVSTTAIYAKVDRSALAIVTQPWPGGAA